MGTVLLFAGLNLAAYYYLFLILLLLAHRDRPDLAALVLAGEAVQRGIAVFEPSQGVQSFYRSALILLLLIAVYGGRLTRGLGKAASAPAR
jgi:hypothetical protein